MTDDQLRELTDARINIKELQVLVANLVNTFKSQQEENKAQIERLEAENKEQSAKLDKVLLTLSEAQGGWKTLVLFGTAATTFGGFAAWLLTKINWS